MDKRFQAFDAWELDEILLGLSQQSYYLTGDKPVRKLLDDCREMYDIKEKARKEALPKCSKCGKLR